MVEVEKALDEAGLTNPHVREYVARWAEVTEPDRIEVVGAEDDARLIQEALDAGELLPAGEGLYYSRSYHKDTARSEERTIVATSQESHKGVYNNWRHAGEMEEIQLERMRGASRGKTMYVIPYLMAPPGSPLEKYAAGIELTDCRPVVLHMIRMARVGMKYIDNLEDPNSFVRAVHVTGDLPNLGQGTPEDQRYFVTVADQRTILHFGSSYGGNALLGKIAHGLRQACYDGWASGEFLAEQFMLLGIVDKQTGKRYHICGGFPSASGKTNLAMTLAPEALGDRYTVEFYGDDIAWLWVNPDDGRVYGMNPENGVFGVAKDTNEKTNPTALESIKPGTGAIFTNVAYNDETHEVWWEGKTKQPPSDLDRLAGLEGQPDLRAGPRRRLAVGAPEQPVHHHAGQRPERREGLRGPGRRPDRRDHLRRPHERPGAAGPGDPRPRRGRLRRAHAGRRGDLRRRGRGRPAALRPDVDAAVHGVQRGRLRAALAGDHRLGDQPADLRARQLVPARPRGRPLPAGRATGRTSGRCCGWPSSRTGRSPVARRRSASCRPGTSSDLDGLDIDDEDLDIVLTIDVERWCQEMGFREAHLKQFENLPEEIWEAHRRVEAALEAARSEGSAV